MVIRVSDVSDPYAQIEQDRRHRLHLSLEASRYPGLLPLLDAAEGAVVRGHYRIEFPLAVGSQFIVWSALELSTGRPIILKQGRFDYRHPVRHGRADAERIRQVIRREYEVLWADQSGTLPRALALLVADSPVPAASSSPMLSRGEVFVAEEYIRGLTLTELALRVWPGRPASERESAVARLALEFLTFWEMLHAAGWFYGDMSADNLLVERAGRLRMVDAGNAIPSSDQVVLTGFTPAFTSRRIFAAATHGQSIPGTLASVLPSLAKVLHFALTGREQFNGHPPDLDDPALGDYSPHCRLVMEMLDATDERPEKSGDARNAIACWQEKLV
jgi:serine/threonine protein kinase